MPIKPNIATKSNFALRPSVPANQKENADEFNLLVTSIRANYDRLLLNWLTDIAANTTLEVGQYILFDGIQYRIITSYNVGNPITWNAANAEAIGGSSTAVISGTYTDIAALLADQAEQDIGKWYLVQDASADPTVDADWAIYQKLATSTANLSDYMKIAEKESLDITINDASETEKGIVQEATDTENQAGTAVGTTLARLYVNPAKLALWWIWIKTLAHTFAAQITFTLAPKFNSTTASQFLKVDANKDLESVPAATQAEMKIGTDNNKPATAKSVEDKRTIKTQYITVSGGILTLPVVGRQECKFICTTVVSSNISIAYDGNETDLEFCHLTIPITGSNIQLQFPASTRMAMQLETATGDGWYQSTKIFQISSVNTADTHEFSLARSSSTPTFKLTFEGPTRA